MFVDLKYKTSKENAPWLQRLTESAERWIQTFLDAEKEEVGGGDIRSRCEGKDTRVRWKHIQVVSTTTEARAIHQRGSVEKNKWSERGRGGWVIYLRARGAAAGGNVSAVRASAALWRGERDGWRKAWGRPGKMLEQRCFRGEAGWGCMTLDVMARVWCVWQTTVEPWKPVLPLSFFKHSLKGKDGRCSISVCVCVWSEGMQWINHELTFCPLSTQSHKITLNPRDYILFPLIMTIVRHEAQTCSSAFSFATDWVWKVFFFRKSFKRASQMLRRRPEHSHFKSRWGLFLSFPSYLLKKNPKFASEALQ